VKPLTLLHLRYFYEPLAIMSPRGCDGAGFLGEHGGLNRRRFFVAIQDYVRSIAATETVSKDQVFRFLEMQFARADKDHDGELDFDELAVFAHAVSCPESDQR
jgi:hypothetical protein